MTKQLKQQITNQGVAQFAGLETYSTFALPQIQTIAAGRFESNGSTVKALGLSINRASLGVYDVTFTTARANANYIITAQIIEPDANRDDTKIHVKDESQTTTGFTLHVYEGDNGGSPDTSRDRDFYVSVQEIADEIEEYYLPIVMTDKFGRIKKVLNKVSNEQPQTIDSGFTNLFSIDFDGVDDRLITNTDSTQAKRSYSFWAKSSATGDNRGLFGHGAADIGAFHFNYGSTNRNLLYLNAEYYVYWVESSKVDDGAWHHWVIYIDPTDIFKCQAYCDGVLQEKYTTSFSSGSAKAYIQPLTIGSDRQAGGLSYEGKLDEFAIFDEELSLNTIKAIYNSGTPTDLTQNSGDYQSADNLAVYYRFENVDFPNADSIIGTATGVMTNMAEDDITTDTP